MAPLVFDALAYAANAPLRLTFGANRSEFRWTDQRSMTFNDLGKLLSYATVGAKDGVCFTPAVFRGNARRKDQAQQIDIVVLDADSGHTFEEIRDAVERKNWRAIIHSTYSHLSNKTLIAANAADKWMSENPGAPIGAYLVAKRGYLPRIMAGAHVVDEIIDPGKPDNRNYLVEHQKCPKFRIILPLSSPWIADNFENQDIANQKWSERIGALAFALDLHHDQSCIDTSRLFYLPRKREEGDEFEHDIVDGNACDLWSLPDAARREERTAERGGPPPPGMPYLQAVKPDHKTYVDERGAFFDLTTWAAKYGLRFEILTALKARSPGVFSHRISGVKHHLTCPNSGDHVTMGAEGTGTFVVNASEIKAAQMPGITSGFIVHCSHNGCADKDRLDHLHALLAGGKLTVADLTDPAFLVPELPPVDLSAIVDSAARTPLRAAPEEAGSNIAPELYTALPGILGVMHQWIMDTAPKAQPALALGGSIAFMASAIGQRVTLQHWDMRPNVYVLAIAHSGAGKERPLSAAKQMAREAGLLEELIGVEEMVSDTGIVNSVAEHPRQLILVDEASYIINSANSKNAGPHMTNIIGTLLKLYSSSRTTYKSKSYADTKIVKIIDQPCVSFYGTATPAGITAALSSSDITSGLLSRMVLFDAGDRDPRISIPANRPVPEEITDWLTAWNRVSPAPNVMNFMGGIQSLEPRTVLVTDEAKAIADDFEGEMHDAKLAARKRGKDALYVRALENALKFALIRACAIPATATDMGPMIDETALRVDAETMRWACDLSRATVRRMDAVSEHIADNPYQQSYNAFVKSIRQAGEKGLTQRDLSRTPAGRHPKKLLEDIAETATKAGDVYWVVIKTGGRERQAWVHRDFMEVHKPGMMAAEAEED